MVIVTDIVNLLNLEVGLGLFLKVDWNQVGFIEKEF